MSDLQTLVSPADAGPPAEDQPVRIDAIQQRVHELASKAQSFLGRPTNANYKQALALYERILGFSDISTEQRAEYGRRLAEARGAYEQFRAQFGELTTARQLQRDEVELIELRKLVNAGVEIGQLAFVALILLLVRAFRVLEIRWSRAMQLAPAYVVGALGAFWTIQRVMMMFGR